MIVNKNPKILDQYKMNPNYKKTAKLEKQPKLEKRVGIGFTFTKQREKY